MSKLVELLGLLNQELKDVNDLPLEEALERLTDARDAVILLEDQMSVAKRTVLDEGNLPGWGNINAMHKPLKELLSRLDETIEAVQVKMAKA